MKLHHRLDFEIGHHNIEEWLALAVIPMAGAIIVVGLVLFLIP